MSVFKVLRRIFRATRRRGRALPRLAASRGRFGSLRRRIRVERFRGQDIPGRGFDVFKLLRRDFRAARRRGRALLRFAASRGRFGSLRRRIRVERFRGQDIPGRGFNVFKLLRRDFRATRRRRAGRGRALPRLAAGRGRFGSLRRRITVERFRRQDIPGRAFNLFKAFRRIFRASAGGAPDASGPCMGVSRLEAGSAGESPPLHEARAAAPTTGRSAESRDRRLAPSS